MFNSISPDLNFTLEQEQNNELNFVDLTIKKTKNKLVFDIYRKPTASDNIIPNDSCHPSEKILSAILYFTNSLNSYDIDRPEKLGVMEITKQTISNNKFHTSVLNRIRSNKRNQTQRIKQKDKSNSQTFKNKHDA